MTSTKASYHGFLLSARSAIRVRLLAGNTARRLGQLCLFDADGNERRVALTEIDGFVWHGKVPGIDPGQHYGYRIHGPWDPVRGQVCNPNKLLLDPYAKAVHGSVKWYDTLFGYEMNFSALRRSVTDSAPHTVRSVVIDPSFNWDGDRPPKTAYPDSVL